MTNLEVTLTLAEYVRRMNSADAAEWLPTPAETVVLYHPWGETFRIDEVGKRNSRNTGYMLHYSAGHWVVGKDDDLLTVSLIPY